MICKADMYEGCDPVAMSAQKAKYRLSPRWIPVNEFMATDRELWMIDWPKNISGTCTPKLINPKMKEFSIDNLVFEWKNSFNKLGNPTHYWSF